MKLAGALAFLLRGGSAGAKFLFVIYLAKVADTQLVGQVALITTLVTLFTQVAGLEIHQVLGRKVHAMSQEERRTHWLLQGFICMVAYLVLIPVAAVAYPELVFQHLPLIGLIFVLEHFITEIFRLHIILLQPLLATRLLAMKNIGWIIIFIVIIEGGFAEPSLFLMLLCWVGVLVVIATPLIWRAVSGVHLRDYFVVSEWRNDADLMLRSARPFIVSATAVAGTGAVDKLIMGSFFPLSDLGVYYFFQTCASVPSLIATFGLGTLLWPRCVQAATLKEESRYRREWHHLLRMFWAVTVGASVIVAFAVPFLLELLSKPEYEVRMSVLYWLLGANALITLCDPHKLHLYVVHRDRALVAGNLFQFLIMAGLIAIACLHGDLTTVAALSACAALLAWLSFQFVLKGSAPRGRVS
jgi:O-antigen/teichoic acid export membrane protein